MTRGKIPYELILLINEGWSRDDLLKMGYKTFTIWYFKRHYKDAVEEKNRRIKSLQPQPIIATEKKIKEPDKRLKDPFMSELKIEEVKKKDGEV